MVADCDVVLVLIGRRYLDVTDDSGSRRLDDPDDIVRLEVEAALRRGIPVVPVLVDGASVPKRTELPEQMSALARRNGIPVRYDPDFHNDMERLIKGLSPSRSAPVAPTTPARGITPQATTGDTDKPSYFDDAPTVYLCHTDEDAAFARGLAEQLLAYGINVWSDTHNLRGSDAWDEMIERVLEREVQYVVVLQSASLTSKTIGYVNKEIYLAIERQSCYRPPRIFMIPAIIDHPSSTLDDLRAFQAVDLTNSEGVQQLVKTIRRDLDAASRSR